MEKIRVTVLNNTGSAFEDGELNLNSGIIHYDSGSISHIVSEKTLGKRILEVVIKPSPKPELIAEDPSPARSKGRPKKSAAA